MANSDYTVRGVGGIAPSARLQFGIDEGENVLALVDFVSNDNELPRVGQGIMVGREIMRIVSIDLWPSIVVARGCADTIPMKHLAGMKVWAFTTATGSDNREYMATETIGIKVLMRSSAQVIPIDRAPPRQLEFNQRFARPYAPGNVEANGVPFYDVPLLETLTDDLVLTWAHRNRVTQSDQLIGHEVGSITPEAGTTYDIEIVRRSGGSVRLVDDITADTWTYPLSQARGDFGVAGGFAYAILTTKRDGFNSLHSYKIPFGLAAITHGWSVDWGNNFGGAP